MSLPIMWRTHRPHRPRPSLKGKKTRKTADLARWTRGRYCGLRAIEPPTRVMVTVNTDRTKVLQTTALPMARVMRAVSCDAYQVHSSPYRVLLTNQGPSKPP